MSEELLSKKEIAYYDDSKFDGLGIYVEPNGVTAFANKKYLRIDMERRREDIKFWAQLLLPVLSFLIAAIALFLNLKTQTEIDNVKKQNKTEIQPKIKVVN